MQEFIRQLPIIKEHIKSHEEYHHIPSGIRVHTSIHPLTIIPSFLPSSLATQLAKDLKSHPYIHKHSDLFHFHQTNSLINSTLPSIQKLEREYISKIGSHLSILFDCRLDEGRFDLSSQRYDFDHFLTCHDDRLEARKVAFILYLVDEEWCEDDGGHLEFLMSDWKDEPVHTPFRDDADCKDNVAPSLGQKCLPAWNTLAFFEVGKTSYHQVCQIASKTRSRYSIAGWFHLRKDDYRLDHKEKISGFHLNSGYIKGFLDSNLQTKILEYYRLQNQNEFDSIHTKYEAFYYKQEYFEHDWLKALRSQINKTWINSEYSLPTRPILKIYKSDCYQQSQRNEKITDGGDGRLNFFFLDVQRNVLWIDKLDIQSLIDLLRVDSDDCVIIIEWSIIKKSKHKCLE